jgi:hypothetical protein
MVPSRVGGFRAAGVDVVSDEDVAGAGAGTR